MKTRLLLAFASVALIMAVSCQSRTNGGYVIKGVVTDPELEGAQMFLVPLENAVKENIDSVVIKDMKFQFTGTEEKMADIRIEMYKRMNVQSLLIVTEPGTIKVTMGKNSSGGGTPQNDSLQVWKDITMKHNEDLNTYLRAGATDAAKAEKEYYRNRSRQMAQALGKDSTLGAFLFSLFR